MHKNISLILKANQDFIRHTESDLAENKPILNSFYESISDIYIPLLDMVEKLENDGVACRIGVVLPPVLCNMLSDPLIQDGFITWITQRIELGHKEEERCKDKPEVIKLIQAKIAENEACKKDFEEKYSKNLVKAFSHFMKKGFIELLATCGTEIFLPHFADKKEVISAQIESGLHSYKQFFGEIPEGFWLPQLGYTPGLERLIKAYGYTYTILDTRSLLLAEKLPSKGTFYPVRTENSLVVFANDCEVDSDLYDEDEGEVFNCVYKNVNRDIGFDLSMKELESVLKEGESRISTGYQYWNKDYDDSEDSYYNPEKALEQLDKASLKFIQKRIDKLNRASELCPESDFVNTVLAFDLEKLHKNWSEGIKFIELVIRKINSTDCRLDFLNNMLENQYSLEKVNPYYSAGAYGGYGESLLSSKNSWMIRYIQKACERMIDLSDRFPTDTGLKTRLLNLGAKELMVAQSCNLAKMIEEDDLPEYAEKRFKESIEAFTAVFDSLGSNTVSTEWLTSIELKDSFFPWMNYRIFSKKR